MVLSGHTRGGTAGLPGAPSSSSGRGVPCTHLGDVGQADEVGDEADSGDEQLPAVAEQPGVLVHQRGDEALHRAELWGGGGGRGQPPGSSSPHPQPQPKPDPRARRGQESLGSRPDSPATSLHDLRRGPSLWASVSPSGNWARWLTCP